MLNKKLESSFSNSLEQAINAITFDKNNVIVAGTGAFKSFRYASDIDMCEYFNKSYSKNDIAKALQTVVKQVLKAGIYYIADIKAGINEKLNIFNNLGEIHNMKIINYDYNKTKKSIQSIRNLIDDEKYNELINANNKAENNNMADWFDLREKIRKVLTIRWDADEVLKGYKLIDGSKLLLCDAVIQFMTKIDLYFDYDGIYTEITNVFMSYLNDKHSIVFLPVANTKQSIMDGIKYSLIENLCGKKPNYLKVMKRVFSLSKLDNNKRMINKLMPLLTGDIALLNKCCSILETLNGMLESLRNPPMKGIKRNLTELKTRLGQIYQFKFSEKSIDDVIDELCNMNNKHEMIEIIDELIKKIKFVVNNETIDFINENHIYPIPMKYLL